MPGDLILYGLRAAVAALALLAAFASPEPVAPSVPPALGAPPAVPLARIPEAAWQYQRRMTAEAHSVLGLDPPLAVLAAQAHQESGWRADARSRVGAMGLTQFMPGTAADMAARYPRDLGPADPLNASWAIAAQVRYMRDLNRSLESMRPVPTESTERSARSPAPAPAPTESTDPFRAFLLGLGAAMAAALPAESSPTERTESSGLSECARWWFGLRCYNGGCGWMARERRLALRAGADPDDPTALERFNAGRSAANFRENTEYPQRIVRRLAPAYDAAGWGRSLDCPGVPQ